MPKFGPASKKRYKTLDPKLQEIVDIAIKIYDFTIVCGYRNKEDQNDAYRTGASQKKWPKSKHNTNPSKAVDLGPYSSKLKDVDWENLEAFIYLAGIILGIAAAKGIKIRWGGDFNMNTIIGDDNFKDWGHFELIS